MRREVSAETKVTKVIKLFQWYESEPSIRQRDLTYLIMKPVLTAYTIRRLMIVLVLEENVH